MLSKTIIMEKIRANMKTYTMILAVILIWLIFGVLTNGVFYSPRNLSNLFRQMTIVSFLAMGMVLVIVTGNIDLSVGSVVGFVSAVVAYLQFYTLPAILPEMSISARGIIVTTIALLVGLGVGLVAGLCQAPLIAYLGIPAFIVTLGGLRIFRGGVLGVTNGATIVVTEKYFVDIAQGYVSNALGWILGLIVIGFIFLGTFRNRTQRVRYGFKPLPLYQDILKAGAFSALVIIFVSVMNTYRGIPNPVLLMAVVALIFTYLANNTKFGRYAYALGGNKEATRLSGINIKAIIFWVFMLMGLLCGIGGIVLTGYVAAGTIGGGQDYELSAIASCIIGGTSFAGGEGTIFGALVGSLIMASLLNGMSVMNMQPFWQYIIQGLVLIVAVYIDITIKKKS